MRSLDVSIELILDVCCIDVLFIIEKACSLRQKRKKVKIPSSWSPAIYRQPHVVTPIGPPIESYNRCLIPPWNRTPFRKAYIHGATDTHRGYPCVFRRFTKYIVNDPLGNPKECEFLQWNQANDGSYPLVWDLHGDD